MEMNQDTQVLAGLLHEQLCEDQAAARACGLWHNGQAAGKRHRSYYDSRALAIMGKLEPEIGAANVLLAARVITSEVALAARQEGRGMAYKGPRGKCPYCGRARSLKKNGTLRKHSRPEMGAAGRTCGGSGQQPS